MFGLTKSRERSEQRGQHEQREGEVTRTTTTEDRPATEEQSVADSRLFRLGRVLFGGVLAYMALDNIRNLDERIQYAESKGAPFPDRSVPAVSVSLLLGSIGVALWRLPSLAAAAVAWFFVSVTPVMHDFWNLDDPEQRQQQLLHFLKNTALLGAALAFIRIARRD